MENVGGYAFEMIGSLNIQTSEGLEIEIPVAYAGDALPDYNSANVSLTAPSGTVEHDVIALNMGVFFGVTQRMSYIFNTESRRWDERQELLALAALTNFHLLLGSDSFNTADMAARGDLQLAGVEHFGGVETNVISGRLANEDITSAETELEITYRIGVDDSLLRHVEVSGEFHPVIVETLIEDIDADSIHATLAVEFTQHGKSVNYAGPNLISPRFGHDATTLDDGRVLVSGGWTGVANNGVIAQFPATSSQIYDAEMGLWYFTERLWEEQVAEQLDLLMFMSPSRMPDGRVISLALTPDEDDVRTALAVFDSETDSWTHLSDIPSSRIFADVVPLNDGRILIVGGVDGTPGSVAADSLDVVETYDPGIEEWQTLEPMNEAAVEQALVSLADGRVLAIGGSGSLIMRWETARAEIFDPATNTWTLTGEMNLSRVSPKAIALTDGRILVTGGQDPHSTTYGDSPDSEIYDPDTGEWTLTGPMSTRRMNHTLTLLPDGRVLAAGGEDLQSSEYILYSSTEVFDPETNTWSPGPELSQPRSSHSATLMPDGRVLLAGGISQEGEQYPIASTEFITP